MTLLKRSLIDEDDETRDRAAISVRILEDAMAAHPYVAPPDDAEADDIPADVPVAGDTAAYVLLETLPMSFDKLERSMTAYMNTPSSMEGSNGDGDDADFGITFDALPIVEDTPEQIAIASGGGGGGMDAYDDPIFGSDGAAPVKKEIIDPAAAVYAIPELASLGRAFRSSPSVMLTESETEYVVQCTKHIFQTHVVLQFSVQNTIEEQRLDNVTVLVDDSASQSNVFTASGEIACDGIKYGESKNCFTILERTNVDEPLSSNTFPCELRFTVVEVDPATGEEQGDTFEEEYPVDELEITTSDFMAKVTVPDFRKSWETIGNSNEVLEKFGLQFKKMDDALAAIISFLGMQPCDGTGQLKPGNTGSQPHMLHMSGSFVSGQQVLARAQVAMADAGSGQVIFKIAVRSDSEAVSRMVADCIH